ncbi:hypothetical protein ACMGDH_14030 [Sphingomonas sp. DT-207]|uniref:hypothetical protein n=1 Tax=Sphingomonas sp. DT-207 TaxID=3396167 RepID=UPI003F1B7611
MVAMGNVWDRTAEFLSENVAAILPIALVAFFIPTSITGSLEPARATGGEGFKLGFGAMQLVFAILSLWGSLAITALALDAGKASAAAGVALRRLPAMLVVAIVMFVAIGVLAAPIGVMLARAGIDFMAPEDMSNFQLGPATGGAIALYALVLVVVLFWLGARLIVATAVIVREGRVLGALGRSWQLTRRHALRIIGVLILYVIVAWVAYLAATAVFGSIFALVAGGEGEGVTLASVLTSIVAAAVQAGFSVLGAAFTAKLYLALAAETSLGDASAAA